MALRISKAERAELARLTRNANRRRQRLIKKGADSKQLPFVFDYSEIQTRGQLNDYKETARKFSQAKSPNYRYIIADGGAVFTEAQRDRLLREQRRANRASKNHQNRFAGERYNIVSEVLSGREPTASRTVGMDRVEGRRKKREYSRQITDFDSVKEYNAYLQRLNEQTSEEKFLQRDEQLRDNYTTSLVTVFGFDADEIINAVLNLELEEFLYAYYTNDAAQIGYIYSPAEYQRKLELLETVWL